MQSETHIADVCYGRESSAGITVAFHGLCWNFTHTRVACAIDGVAGFCLMRCLAGGSGAVFPGVPQTAEIDSPRSVR